MMISIGRPPSPLSFQKLNDGLLEGWLIRRREVIAFTPWSLLSGSLAEAPRSFALQTVAREEWPALLLAKTFGVPVEESIKRLRRIVNDEEKCVTLPRTDDV